MSIYPKLALLLAIPSCSQVKERSITIESKPVISKESGYTLLTASQGDVEVFTAWPRDGEKQTAKLDLRKTYRFDLLQQRRHLPHRILDERSSYWSADLVSISDGDQMIYDATICPVHRIQMKRHTVLISYGFPSFPKGYLEARKTRFPNANSMVLGGCTVGPHSDKHERTFRCERCIQEERAWEKANSHR